MVDCTWQLTSTVRDVEPDTSHDYERLDSRLRIHRATLRQCLANKPSTRYQLNLLRLVAFLSTLFVAMKRRMKVPDIARTLHNMTGTRLKPSFHPDAIACVAYVAFGWKQAAANRMLGRSSGNHDWPLANASACV